MRLETETKHVVFSFPFHVIKNLFFFSMPDPEKKNQHKKGKNDPKEQRKPRQRNQAAPEKTERKTDASHTPKVVVPEKPVYEEPGPEFFKGLKRETDDILKITEEANAKYKKKEIQSNWEKYEVPIESYDEVEEQENMGADYEQLIQAPLSIGGHFQFKHEKSWDVSTGPSLYDKYFEINMNDLATALCTIPFYERNSIDKSIFTETDIQAMDHRTTRYKHKYFKIATTESELQEKFIKSLKEDYSKTEVLVERNDSESDAGDTGPNENEINFDNVEQENAKMTPGARDNLQMVFKRDEPPVETNFNKNITPKHSEVIDNDNIDDIILGTNDILDISDKTEVKQIKPDPKGEIVKTVATASAEPKKNTVIESPEDLEKWLDDFLEE